MAIFDSLRNGQPVYPLYVPGKFDFVEPSNLLTLAKLSAKGDKEGASKSTGKASKDPMGIQGHIAGKDIQKDEITTIENGLFAKFQTGAKKAGTVASYVKTDEWKNELYPAFKQLEDLKDIYRNNLTQMPSIKSMYEANQALYSNSGGAGDMQYAVNASTGTMGVKYKDEDGTIGTKEIKISEYDPTTMIPYKASEWNELMASANNVTALFDKKGYVKRPSLIEYYDASDAKNSFKKMIGTVMTSTRDNMNKSDVEGVLVPTVIGTGKKAVTMYAKTDKSSTGNKYNLDEFGKSLLSTYLDDGNIRRDAYNDYIRGLQDGNSYVYNADTKKYDKMTFNEYVAAQYNNMYGVHVRSLYDENTTYTDASRKAGGTGVANELDTSYVEAYRLGPDAFPDMWSDATIDIGTTKLSNGTKVSTMTTSDKLFVARLQLAYNNELKRYVPDVATGTYTDEQKGYAMQSVYNKLTDEQKKYINKGFYNALNKKVISASGNANKYFVQLGLGEGVASLIFGKTKTVNTSKDHMSTLIAAFQGPSNAIANMNTQGSIDIKYMPWKTDAESTSKYGNIYRTLPDETYGPGMTQLGELRDDKKKAIIISNDVGFFMNGESYTMVKVAVSEPMLKNIIGKYTDATGTLKTFSYDDKAFKSYYIESVIPKTEATTQLNILHGNGWKSEEDAIIIPLMIKDDWTQAATMNMTPSSLSTKIDTKSYFDDKNKLNSSYNYLYVPTDSIHK